ncbi:DUF2829 domain-containing protein [Xenorhabdus sp. Vera]|uniref:Thoeris anti-defense Tad2 family protein n=1 Tax=Xenorhabdus koppenhoeferi TaxID=351659 RepID=UPI001987C9A4|nr:MW1434 family type I TA system toxin [Xenorhabdus sp. Vera]MBD2812276.1 DUF2829 domain-containing protein [Xenorhabdus sp. Vera]
MSEINKLDNTECPFDPDQYKKKIEIDDIAPAGSFPWAMIKVYLGKQVSRNGWASSDEYIKLIPASTGSDGKNIPPQIWVTDKDNEQTWTPEQEDMVACDWELVKVACPEGTMLSFDLEIGTSKYAYGQGQGQGQDWGYLTKEGDISSGESTFGTLTHLQSTLGIGNILTFILIEEPIGSSGTIQLQVDTQNQPDLSSKNLEITVNGSTYPLGTYSSSTTDFVYTSDGAKNLGDLLKQNVDKTLHLCFNWK